MSSQEWVACAVLGHRADRPRQCRCGDSYLLEDGSVTRIRHILSCFLMHHRFVRLAERDGYHEYVCHGCGHPLLIAPGAPSPPISFAKRPRYRCSIFGHRVKAVANRDGFVEYACACGHTFLKKRRDFKKIKHPLKCALAGHFVRFLTTRRGHSEFVCDHCGHPFLFNLHEGSAPCRF